MKKKKANYAKKVGLPPESLIYTGNQKHAPGELEIIVYDENTCIKEHFSDVKKLQGIIDRTKVNLIINSNLTDVNLIEKLGQFFTIQTMVLEDVLNTTHLPKVEESGEELLLTLKLLGFSDDGELVQQHLSLLLGEYFVIVFKDFENQIFSDIISRIVNGKSKARQKKSDYLFYLLTDTLIDSYYNIVNEIDNLIDKMEITLLENPDENYMQKLYHIKQNISGMRGVIYPTREALLNIVQGDYSRIGDPALIYLQDVKDHITHIIQMFETSRDTLSDLLDLNNSNINNRLNASMKILTIITTLFIPLTLVAGIYGMNFRFMPELSWKFGYPLALGIMLVTAGIMFYIMKRNKLL